MKLTAFDWGPGIKYKDVGYWTMLEIKNLADASQKML